MNMDFYDGKVFLESGNWVLVDNVLQHPVINPTHSRVAHYCPEYTNPATGPVVWTRMENLACERCGEIMPDNIQTAFTLHNFDVINDAHPISTSTVRFSLRYKL